MRNLAAINFSESDLLFRFPNDWVVRKYDDTVAYQSLSGHGLKGVDFIALSPDDRLWLIEVKNFRPRVSERNGREYRAKRKLPADLATAVARKFMDSQRLIRIVDTWLRRRWWRRLQLWWLERQRRPTVQSNYWFWAQARRRCASPGNTTFVLWIETPEHPTDYADAVSQQLMERMPAGENVVVGASGRSLRLPFGLADQAGAAAGAK